MNVWLVKSANGVLKDDGTYSYLPINPKLFQSYDDAKNEAVALTAVTQSPHSVESLYRSISDQTLEAYKYDRETAKEFRRTQPFYLPFAAEYKKDDPAYDGPDTFKMTHVILKGTVIAGYVFEDDLGHIMACDSDYLDLAFYARV
jgi:hypothetical protein